MLFNKYLIFWCVLVLICFSIFLFLLIMIFFWLFCFIIMVVWIWILLFLFCFIEFIMIVIEWGILFFVKSNIFLWINLEMIKYFGWFVIWLLGKYCGFFGICLMRIFIKCLKLFFLVVEMGIIFLKFICFE